MLPYNLYSVTASFFPSSFMGKMIQGGERTFFFNSFVYLLNNLYPESLKNAFKATTGVHSYNVRGASNNVFVPRPSTEAAKRAFSYRGEVMWNGLENVLKDEVNLNSFKSALSF